MPGFPFPGRPGGEHDEPLLDMIIARRALPPDAPSEMHDLARLLAALTGPAESEELTGEAAVRAAFSREVSRAGVSPAARRPMRRRRARRSRGPVRSRTWLATAMVAAVAGLGSVLAVYAHVLPSPIHRLSSVPIAVPAAHSSGSHRVTTLGSGRPATPTVQATRAPARRPRHPASTARRSDPDKFPTPYDSRSAWPQLPGHRGSPAGCVPDLWPSPSPLSTGSDQAGSPSFSHAFHCAGIPTTGPSANPYRPSPP